MICDDARCEGEEPAPGDAVTLTGTSAGSQDARLRRGRAGPRVPGTPGSAPV